MKKTNVFAVIVAILVAVTYYYEFYRVNADNELKETDAKLVPYPADQIHQIRVDNESGHVVLQRTADGWKLEEPIKDWADNSYIDDFVGGLTTEKSIETAAEGESVQWSAFGLESSGNKKPAQILFVNQQSQTTAIAVSEKKNFEGNSFVRRNQENRVLVATSQWPLRAKVRAIDFRDKRLFRGKISAVQEIEVKSTREEIKLLQKDGHWIAEKEPKLALDQNRVREILTSLNETSASDYIEAIPKDAVFKAKIHLKLTDKNWSAELRQTAADKTWYAVTTEPAFQMKMAPGQADKFSEMTLGSLRFRREAFDFKAAEVQRIEISTAIKKTAAVKSENAWKVEGNADAKVDNEAVKNMIARLNESAITEYLLPNEQKAFKNAENKMTLKNEKGDVLFEISWGVPFKKKIATGEKALVLAKTNLYAEPFGLDQNVIESWGINSLFPSELSPKPSPASKAEPAKDLQ